MKLSKFILLFNFNVAGKDTDENNKIILYNSEYVRIDCIQCFDDFQRIYAYEGDYIIRGIQAGREKHTVCIVVEGGDLYGED